MRRQERRKNLLQDPPEDSPVSGEQTGRYIDRAEQEEEPVQGDTQDNKEATATQAREEATPVKGEQTGHYLDRAEQAGGPVEGDGGQQVIG